MADEFHLKKLLEGSETWNEWRSSQPDNLVVDLSGAELNAAILDYADLNGANLTGANLNEAKLFDANFTNAILIQANLKNTDLREAKFQFADLRAAILENANLFLADLSEANLGGANLRDASLAHAYLVRANLKNAMLYGANLKLADLKNADLRGAEFYETILGATNLSGAIGLQKIEHSGPSILDHRTIESSGTLPVNFLRGCGLPESIIEYLPSMLNQPISFYSCFISYSHEDKAFARRLHDQLQGQGIRCWLDDHQVLPGDDIHKQIDQGIRLWDKVLLCASQNSLSSWWVDNEIDAAFQKEQQLMKERGEKMLSLIPLNLDDHMFSEKWENGKANQVKSRLAADFTGWENDNDIFEQAFEKVLRALKTNDAGRELPPVPKL